MLVLKDAKTQIFRSFKSLDDWRESAGYQRLYPELVTMNATRGMFQQSLGWIISEEMAAQMLPLLQTILFLMVACSIFVVFPLTLFPGGYVDSKGLAKILNPGTYLACLFCHN